MIVVLKTLDVPTSNISKLKKSPSALFDQAEKAKSGIYIFNRNTPSGIVMSVKDYENMVHEIEQLQDKIYDLEVVDRIKNNSKLYSDEEVRGASSHRKIELDDNDGWE